MVLFDKNPDSLLNARNQAELTASDYDILVIPDIHSYERDVYAYDLLMESVFPELAAAYNIKKVVQLGDLLECGDFSRYAKSHIDQKVKTIEEEIRWSITDFWNPLKSCFSGSEFIFVEGNHEHRWQNYLLSNIAKENLHRALVDVIDPCTVYERIGVDCLRYGGESVPDSTACIAPGLLAVHGWSFADNAAKAHLDRVIGAHSIVFGHTHRIQSYIKRDPIKNRLVGAWSFGALAKSSMFYQKGIPNNHALGFGIISVRGNHINVNTVPILDEGSRKRSLILPNGSYYAAE